MRGYGGRSRSLLGHLDREAVGGPSEKFPWEEMGRRDGPRPPHLCPCLHTRGSLRVQTLSALVTHRGSPQASLQALALPTPPLQCLLLLPSAVAAPAEHLTPTPLHPIPPSLFLVLLSPCLGSCCSLPDISSHAASVKHSLLIPLHGGLGTHSVQRPSPVDPNLTTGT